ncbi:MAG: hypothetical protein ACK5SI_01625 [Planctomycetia bacterium]|jgi:hypothetical protein
MINPNLLKDIARIGSQEFQRALCVAGTTSRYCLLDELIEMTMDAAKNKATHPVLSKTLSPNERDALLAFHSRVDELFDQIPWSDDGTTIEDIVNDNDAMSGIRVAADECLRSVGASFSTNELVAG